MSGPLVSVCIGAYNRERYIRECLESVFAQTYRNLEVIVVDDASTDKTVEILAEYRPRIQLVVRAVNSGMCGITRNDAMRLARGEYLAFLDSDDKWYPQKLERQIRFFEEHPHLRFCHAYCHVIDAASRVLRVRHEGRLPPTGDCFEPLLRHCFISTSSVMMHRSVVAAAGMFPDDPVYGAAGEEYFYFLRIARDLPVGLVDEVLACYRENSPGSMVKENGWKYVPEVVPLHKLILQSALWRGRTGRAAPRQAFLAACHENAEYWRARDAGHSRWFAGQALAACPWSRPAWTDWLKAVGKVLQRGQPAGAPVQ